MYTYQCCYYSREETNYHISTVQIFLKYYHIERLGQLLASYDWAAITAQRVVQGWLARRRAAVLKEVRRQRAAVRIQAGTM